MRNQFDDARDEALRRYEDELEKIDEWERATVEEEEREREREEQERINQEEMDFPKHG